jgi:hypothetical protein
MLDPEMLRADPTFSHLIFETIDGLHRESGNALRRASRRCDLRDDDLDKGIGLALPDKESSMAEAKGVPHGTINCAGRPKGSPVL